MIEFDVDMGYLLDYDELDKVVLNDENGEHEPMEFVPKDTETVGNSTDLSKRLREVHGLHAFAELFGFDWTGESDWDWHDVACAMADAVDAATVSAGTCHIEVHDNLDESEGMGDVWLECDRCHWQMPLEPTTPRFKYCPNCRAEIKEETE